MKYARGNTCKNCRHFIHDTYNNCSNCGMSCDIKRFNFTLFFKDFIVNLDIGFDRLFVQTFKCLTLTKDPGRNIREFIYGNHYKLYEPMKFLLIVGTLTTIITVYYDVFIIADEAPPSFFFEGTSFSSIEKIYSEYFMDFWKLANAYSTVINILSTPIFAFFTYCFFRSKTFSFNYVEILILNIYIVSIQLFAIFLFVPILHFFPENKGEIISIYIFTTMMYNIWVFICFFSHIRMIKRIIVSVISICFGYIGTFFCMHLLFLFLKELQLLSFL
ncbi:MAG: hypothetical protein QM536_08195 [Chitinophagaceae bacterium]|nr:hypothetical protein [Chitinophagaceae bacterium]